MRISSIIPLVSALLLPLFGHAQFNPELQDSTIDNMVHPDAYTTCRLGELGGVHKGGIGKQSMILIPGWGFDASVFDGFMKANEKNYRMYAITPAGFGGTAAPPMPDTSLEYSEATWTNGIVTGILDLIEKEKLEKPVIVGHFNTGSTAALILALKHPDRISKAVVISGAPYRYIRPRTDTAWGREAQVTTDQRNKFIKSASIPWFKTVTRKTWDNGNYRPNEYSIDSARGKDFFERSAGVPLPVMIRYLLENNAYDASAGFTGLRVPLLVLIPSFSEEFFREQYVSLNKRATHEWVKYLFQDVWNSSRGASPLLQFRTIPQTRYFMWYDNPDTVYSSIRTFVNGR